MLRQLLHKADAESNEDFMSNNPMPVHIPKQIGINMTKQSQICPGRDTSSDDDRVGTGPQRKPLVDIDRNQTDSYVLKLKK